MSSNSGNPPEQALKQIVRLMDLGCDLERNSSDSDFAKANPENEIIFVLDENVFEMFIRPFRHREGAETFYGDLWSLDGPPGTEWRTYEAMAAAVTAEYVVNGRIPGRKGNDIYLTEFHRWELAHRIDVLSRELDEAISSQTNRCNGELKRKLRIITELFQTDGEKATRGGSADQDGKLDEDLERLGDNVDAALRNRLRASRIAANFLATSELVEPLDQLRRFVSTKSRGRIKSIESRFAPNPSARNIIERDAEKWFGNLAMELARPGHRHRARANNSNAARALWNDARSLAYLSWVNRKLIRRGQRMVFVTGDLVLFDAYRRWYFTDSEQGAAADEPFLLRRTTQYTPIFNPLDSRGDLTVASGSDSDRTAMFAHIQRAVEATLLALPRKVPGENATPASITSWSRESVAMSAVDFEEVSSNPVLAPLAKEMSEGWVNVSTSVIERNRSLWHRLERLSIGSSFNLVVSRIDDGQRAVAEKFAKDKFSSDYGEFLRDYISGVLDELVGNSIQLWIPLAESLNSDNYYDPEWRKAPIKRFSIGVSVPTPSELADLNCAPRPPEVVFAQASIKAINLQDIGNAVRFAGIALRADAMARNKGEAIPGFDLELRFLNAVAYRMQITTVDAHLRATGDTDERRLSAARAIEQVNSFHSKASSYINECISAHFDGSEVDAYHNSRFLRALSERASLHLFVSTSYGLSHRSYRRMLPYAWESAVAVAEGDLSDCLDFRVLAGDDPIVAAARDQFIPNIAGLEVLKYLIDDEAYMPINWKRGAKRELSSFWLRETNPHPLLSAELYSFYWLRGESPPKVARYKRINAWKELSQLRLPLDRALFKSIQRRILNDYEG